MDLILTIYKRAFDILMKKPVRLWGISLLYGFLSAVAVFLFNIPIGLGICIGMLLNASMLMVFLHGYRGEEVYAKQLFECFKSWESVKRICAGLGWRALWVFLWMLIPIVGPIFAIIRLYEYWLTPYILLYEPEIALTDAIEVSKVRTKGYKGRMFFAMVLIPVAFFLVCLILSALSRIRGIGGLFGFILTLFVLAFSLLYPLFSGLVGAAFYEEISAAAKENGEQSSCPNCGEPLNEEEKFCPNCGQPVE